MSASTLLTFNKEYYGSGPISDREARVLGPAVERLAEEKGGSVTSGDLLEAARPEESPFHKHFTWDNLAAAEAFRLHQANVLLGAIHVRIVDEQDSSQVLRDAPVVLSIPAPARAAYEDQAGVQHNLRSYTLTSLLEDRPDQQKLALEDAERMLLAATRRLRKLKDLFESRYRSAPKLMLALEEFEAEASGENREKPQAQEPTGAQPGPTKIPASWKPPRGT